MALAAGSFVMAAAATVIGNIIYATSPLIGIVESTAGGTPPATNVVAWEDGTRTSYATSGTGGTSVLHLVGVSANASIVGSSVICSALPDPGSRTMGTVIGQFTLADPEGTVLGEYVIVKCALGYYVVPASTVTVIPSA